MTRTNGRRGAGYHRANHISRAVAAIREGRIGEAEPELEAAIALDPEAPDAYWLRGSIRRQQGRYAEAAGDWARCRALDPHFLEAGSLRETVERVREAFLYDAAVEAADPGPEPRAVQATDLRAVIDDRRRELDERRRLLERPGCPLPCPSQCCYFDEEPFVLVEPSKLAAVVQRLRELRLERRRHLGRSTAACWLSRVGPEREATFVREERGTRCLYFVRRDDRAQTLAYRDRPRRTDLRALPWLTPASRACRFVTPAGCLLHDVGDPPGLEICRRFLCLSGLVFTILGYLDVVPRDALQSRPIGDLHEQAILLVPLLGEFYTGRDASAALAAIRGSLRRALEADAAGRQEAVRAALDDYRSATGQLAAHQARQRRILQQALEAAPAAASPGSSRNSERRGGV